MQPMPDTNPDAIHKQRRSVSSHLRKGRLHNLIFHTTIVNVVSAPTIVPTLPPTHTLRVEDVTVASPTCTRQCINSRKVKKQKTERVRRARIAEKIAQLHGLALSMVGVEVSHQSMY
ncbi:hypothetical protein TcWFU_000716 [Taenia crassiceps]|uniref:BHLH domain-containing protein n=1 Tax=Taenia crassiceps TaxID=6207 RepID=A0ABR4QG19_9CEST